MLEQYAPPVRDNDIDWEVLRRLTVDDVRELGVSSIGQPPPSGRWRRLLMVSP
jgi:hypothetical protein